MIKATKLSQIQRAWHLVDAKDQVLGRLATRITPLLMGKTKPYFVQSLDCGDHVVVINARDVRVTGKKEQEKKYYAYSGYPGGLKVTTFRQLKKKSPEKIIINAINNMLPKNRLRSLWLRRLHVFADKVHPYEEKFTPLHKEGFLSGSGRKSSRSNKFSLMKGEKIVTGFTEKKKFEKQINKKSPKVDLQK